MKFIEKHRGTLSAMLAIIAFITFIDALLEHSVYIGCFSGLAGLCLLLLDEDLS